LTPVLLELGCKSPVIVHESFPLKVAAERIALGKCWNAGQTCVAPDHLYLPKGKSGAFIKEFESYVRNMYPSLLNNNDYTSVANERQYKRLQRYLADARKLGAQVIEITPASADLSASYQMPITVVSGVTPDMALMHDEASGPVLARLASDDVHA